MSERLPMGEFAVVVPGVRGLQRALHQHAFGAVLAHFEFVAHHRHFFVEQRLLDLAVDHAVGFQLERELKVLVGGVERLEVIGAVPGGGAVHVGAVILEFLFHILAGLSLEEHHVLQQVRHTGFAVAFLA